MKQKQYINEIVQRSCLSSGERRRLKKDLENEINFALEQGESIEQIIERMGDPDKIAAELYENSVNITARPFREYKSERTLFGLPLVHIIRANYSPSFQSANSRGIYGVGLPTACGIFALGPKAKGFVAVGNLSTGIISIGNLSAGVVSIGNLSAGLFSLGNLALGLLIAMGNGVAGLISTGNVALGYATVGNVALGKYAVGNKALGTFAFSFRNLSTKLDELKIFLSELNAPAPINAFYKMMVEKISEYILNPISLVPLYIAFGILLTGIILLSCVIPSKLLD